ncbi:3'-5' exonuclease [Corynebacterium striatum]|uniref:3'-5' exonuclease n=3 Tax=Corynebacterium striatum TaxID=43770 RepID=UPI00254C0FCE|nr:3'-5' exonuclease [Corynebacterium striatum]MDK8881250.1 3'-5' exonuclease [Corynebacterium striatum]
MTVPPTRKPGTNYADYRYQLRRTGIPTAEHQYEHSTVHGFKGLETDSIVLVIPGDRWTGDTIRDWGEGKSSEARRVLYVGASRAKRLLILAVHNKYTGAVKLILERDEVPLAFSD